MVFESLKEALQQSGIDHNYHFVRILATGRWVRVQGPPVGIMVRKLRRNYWIQIVGNGKLGK